MRIQLLSIIFLLLATINFCRGQAKFYKLYGNGIGAYSISATRDSSYIISGYDFLIKINNFGDTLWAMNYSGISGAFYNDALETTDGGYVFLCNVPTTQLNDALLIKTDSVGNILWNKRIGRTNPSVGDQYNSVFQTSDNGLLISGTSLDANGPIISHCIVKLDSAGNILWNKIFNDKNTQSSRGDLTSDNGYVFTGGMNGTVNSIFFTKTDSAGNAVINRRYGNYDCLGLEVKQISDGGFIIVGRYIPDGAPILLKLDSVGNFNWAKKYIIPTINYNGITIIQTNDGGFTFLVGSVGNYETYCVKTDSVGNVIWGKKYDGNGKDILQTSDNGYLIAGHRILPLFGTILIKTDQFGSVGCFDSTIIVTDSSLQLQAFQNFASPFSDITSTTIPISTSSGDTLITECFTTGLFETYSEEKIIAFPNPTSNFIYFNKENLTAEIFDLTGRKLLHQKIKDKQLNISNFSAGIYFLKVKDGSAEKTFKIIKQ